MDKKKTSGNSRKNKSISEKTSRKSSKQNKIDEKKHLEISENIKKIDLKKKIREYCFCLPVEFSLNELFHGVM